MTTGTAVQRMIRGITTRKSAETRRLHGSQTPAAKFTAPEQTDWQTPVEYIWTAEFDRPECADEILSEIPAVATALTKAPRETPAYLAELYRVPLLTPDEEFRLFRQMHFWRHRAEKLRRRMVANGASPRRKARFSEAMQRSLALRNRIATANLRLVVAIARTMVDDANRLDDLISDGNLPLLRAVEIFDYTRGLRFSTYATWAVRNGLFRSTQRNRKLAQRNGPLAEEDLTDCAAEPHLAAGEMSAMELQQTLDRLLGELPQRDRSVVEARFGLGRRPRPARFREIAEEFGVSTERARQLVTRVLHRLKHTISTTVPDLAPAV